MLFAVYAIHLNHASQILKLIYSKRAVLIFDTDQCLSKAGKRVPV